MLMLIRHGDHDEILLFMQSADYGAARENTREGEPEDASAVRDGKGVSNLCVGECAHTHTRDTFHPEYMA